MIEPQELRPGNLVSWNPRLTHPATTTPSMEVEVSAVLAGKIEYIFPNIEHRVEPFEDDVAKMGSRFKSFEELEPIRLTPEILERTGLALSENNTWANNDGSFVVRDSTVQYKGDRKDTIEFLHQLQNTYFDLTGEELKIDHS